MTDVLSTLAGSHGLKDRSGTSAGGLTERYLYSPDMDFRYVFGRWWEEPDLTTTDVWILLNPATGDTELRRRPTLERCVTRSRDARRSGLLILNLFAFRHTDPHQLRRAADPNGPANDDVLRALTKAAPRTIAAWGGGGRLFGRRGRLVRCSTSRCAWERLGWGSRDTRFTSPATRRWCRGTRCLPDTQADEVSGIPRFQETGERPCSDISARCGVASL